jgi:hypothetical protein
MSHGGVYRQCIDRMKTDTNNEEQLLVYSNITQSLGPSSQISIGGWKTRRRSCTSPSEEVIDDFCSSSPWLGTLVVTRWRRDRPRCVMFSWPSTVFFIDVHCFWRKRTPHKPNVICFQLMLLPATESVESILEYAEILADTAIMMIGRTVEEGSAHLPVTSCVACEVRCSVWVGSRSP